MAVNNIDSLNSNLANAHTLTAKENEYVQEAEVDGIEILVNMAKQGKIDPWNVDIVEVTDKYLMHLFQSKAQNLRLTGRTLLFAAILLKLKSNVLEGLDVLDFEPQPEIDLEYDDAPLDYQPEEYVPTNKTASILDFNCSIMRQPHYYQLKHSLHSLYSNPMSPFPLLGGGLGRGLVLHSFLQHADV